MVAAREACSYAIGDIIPIVEWRRVLLYQSSIQAAILCRASSLVVNVCLLVNSVLRVEKNDSAGALSRLQPTLPIDWATPMFRQAAPNSSAV